MIPTVAIYGIQDRDEYELPKHAHDHSVCVMENGRVLQYLQLERHTRRKNDNRLSLWLDDLVERGHLILPDQFDLVSANSYVGSAFLSKTGRFRFEAPHQSALVGDLVSGTGWYSTAPRRNHVSRAFLCEHELAHVGSVLPFVGTLKNNSLLVHFDGGASISCFSAYYYRGDNDSSLRPVMWSWNLLKMARCFGSNRLVFQILHEHPGGYMSAPGKLMGLAPYGTLNQELRSWLRANDYFFDHPNRLDEFYAGARALGYQDQELNVESRLGRDIARAMQQDFQDALLHQLEQLVQRTRATNLYYSGGCALNIVANTAIIRSGMFETVFVPPCCNDSGLSLGAASFLEWKKHGEVRQHSPYLNGSSVDGDPAHTVQTISAVSDLLIQQKVIGICNGPGEIGPRALGNRSLVALGNSARLRDKVSVECKGREAYRPVAPIMLAEIARSRFGSEAGVAAAEYMLYDFAIGGDAACEGLEGVVHVDGTSRVQVLARREQNPFMFDLLTCLWLKHQVPCLINTSFNKRGEPIVQTHDDALRSATDMRLDGIVLDGRLQLLAA